MDYQAFENFLRVAELGSVSKAAIDLKRSQPSLSRQIGVLEHRVGAKLFTRTPTGVVLTDAGRVLADSARPILEELSALVDRVGEKADGCLSVGAPRSWQAVFTASYATQFMRQCPTVSLKISEAVSSALRDQMLAGSLDLSIVPFEDSPPKGYTHTALIREPLILIAPREYGLSPEVAIALTDLNAIKLVLPPKPNIVRLRVEHALSRRGLAFKTIAEIDTLSLGLEMVRAGFGSTVAPSCALQGKNVLDESFSWGPIQGLSVTWALCENEARAHSRAVRQGKKLLLETVVRSVESAAWFGAELVARRATPDAVTASGIELDRNT